MIRRAKIQEIPEIMEVARACAAHMINLGIFQWNDQYPTAKSFANDISRQELYVLLNEDRIIGMVALTTIMDEEYKPVEWLTKSRNNLYIHRLGVHPDFQGQGYAQKIMDYAEHFAKENGYNSVRLDTFSKNRRNQRFYEQRGYIRLENIYFPMQSDDPFHCYELII